MRPPMRRAGNDFRRVVHFGQRKNGKLFDDRHGFCWMADNGAALDRLSRREHPPIPLITRYVRETVRLAAKQRLANYTSCGVNRFDCADDAGSTGLIGRRSAASSRSAISERLDFSSCMRFGSGAGGIWNTGSKDGGTGAA